MSADTCPIKALGMGALTKAGDRLLLLETSETAAQERLNSLAALLKERGRDYTAGQCGISVDGVTIIIAHLDEDPRQKTRDQVFNMILYSLACEHDPRFFDWRARLALCWR